MCGFCYGGTCRFDPSLVPTALVQGALKSGPPLHCFSLLEMGQWRRGRVQSTARLRAPSRTPYCCTPVAEAPTRKREASLPTMHDTTREREAVLRYSMAVVSTSPTSTYENRGRRHADHHDGQEHTLTLYSMGSVWTQTT